MKSILLGACALLGLVLFAGSLVAFGLGLTPDVGGLVLIFVSAGLTMFSSWHIWD